ncbi:MAG TPA: hypothetical protein VFQ53_28225 [Kofleriaceae bacterium]|nr:hypothetical protein [Kofleriaceae bacterium]
MTGLLLYPLHAHAQSAEAEVLFRDGRKLIKQGNLAAGCDKLDASERLESSVGTLLNLGDCREKLGKVASAWAAFKKAEAMAKRAGNDEKRLLEARRRATALEPKLSNLVIWVDQKLDGLVIKRDGEPIDPAVWNTPVPVDPDTYDIVVEAPGYKAWKTQVTVDAKVKRKLVTVPRLERAPVTETPPTVASPTTPDAPPTSVVTTESPTSAVVYTKPGRWTTTRGVSVAFGVAGAGAFGAGIYLGLRAKDLQDRSDRLCPDTQCGDPEGLRLNKDARDSAKLANIFYGVGGAAAVTATVLWFVGKPDERTTVTPTVGGGHVGVSLSRRF